MLINNETGEHSYGENVSWQECIKRCYKLLWEIGNKSQFMEIKVQYAFTYLYQHLKYFISYELFSKGYKVLMLKNMGTVDEMFNENI